MAKLLEAQLFVRSIPNEGSCFGLVMQSTSAPVATDTSAQNHDLIGNFLYGKRIAILDDDEIAVDYLAELLGSWNLNVSVALSSDMLHELVNEEGNFDLVLSDYHLGLADETGLDVLIKAQSMQPDRPPVCVLITGDTSSELVQAARSRGIELLYKPLSPVRLRAYLNTLLIPNG